MDIDKLKGIKEKQAGTLDAISDAEQAYNDTIDEFDDVAKDCEYYVFATCHGEDDPECAHPDREIKWCEAQDCPLLK